MRLRGLSECGSVVYLVERPTRATRAEQHSDTVQRDGSELFRAFQRFLEVFRGFSEVFRGFQGFFRGFSKASQRPFQSAIFLRAAGRVAPNRVAP